VPLQLPAVELVLIGCNDDFNSRGSNLAELLAHDPDLIFIQEGKAADYRGPARTRGPRQAAAPDPHLGRPPGHLEPRPRRRARWSSTGTTPSPAPPAGSPSPYAPSGSWPVDRLAPRPRLRRRVFLFSAHRPPVRARRFWHPFDLALWARLRLALAAGRLVLGQMDSNQHGGPPTAAPRLRWVAVGRSIDGFVLSRSDRGRRRPESCRRAPATTTRSSSGSASRSPCRSTRSPRPSRSSPSAAPASPTPPW
jgi:hypothetical protein